MDQALLQEVLHLLTSHGLVVISVKPKEGEIVVKIPEVGQ